MLLFKKSEFVGLAVILGVAGVFFGFNMRDSLRKARDAQRKSDIGTITASLYEFQKLNGYFPTSTDDGKIVACGHEVDELGYPVFHTCDWYGEGFTEGVVTLLGDPRQGQGRSYFYVSDMKHFQIFASLEGNKDESEYDERVVSRNLMCGRYICNYGKTDGRTPIDKSLQEFEEEELKDE